MILFVILIKINILMLLNFKKLKLIIEVISMFNFFFFKCLMIYKLNINLGIKYIVCNYNCY